MTGKVIIIEDNLTFSAYLQRLLASKGWKSVAAASFQGGKKLVMEADKEDIILSDHRLPSGSGLELLKWMRGEGMRNPFILMTEYDLWKTAVDAIQLGAVNYLPKHSFEANIFKFLEEIRKRQEYETRGKPSIKERKSAAFQEIYRRIRLVAKTNMSVLILGESGCGKEHIAQMIRECGKRADKPMQSLNCACLTDDLANSILFGHEKGAFTGAETKEPGVFGLADGGTLFLDEVGNLSMKVQQMLLRTLQERTYRTVGGTKDQRADVRIISATNEDLRKAIAEGRFRSDLFYRLQEHTIRIPPLRECKEDIMPLAEYFVEEFNEENGMTVNGFDGKAKELLVSYSWPGNVRELKQVVRNAALMTQEGEITADALEIADGTEEIISGFDEKKLQIDRERLEWAIGQAGGNKRQAAKLLGISPTTLYDWMRKCGMPIR